MIQLNDKELGTIIAQAYQGYQDLAPVLLIVTEKLSCIRNIVCITGKFIMKPIV